MHYATRLWSLNCAKCGPDRPKNGGDPVGSPPGPLDSISRPISRVLSARAKRPRVTAIPLRRRLPGALSNLPGRPDPDIDPEARWPRASRRPYSVLLPVGFAMPLALPQARCALTAPFHPYRSCLPRRDATSGGLFSVALSLGLTPAGRYPAPYVHGARTFLSGHLSALARATVQPTDTLGMGCGRTHVKPVPQLCVSYAAGAVTPNRACLRWDGHRAQR